VADIIEAWRYPEVARCSTPLDPIADCTAWIAGLRSAEFSGQLLRRTHGFVNRREINEASKTIRAHAQGAIEFLDQAHSGPSRNSFLPLYYAMLNLAKIAIVFRGGAHELQKQRHHGASWSGIKAQASDLVNDHITVYKSGAISLFYRTVVGTGHPPLEGKVVLRQVYPLIPSVGFEYDQAYKARDVLMPLRVYFNQHDENGWCVEVTPSLHVQHPLTPKSPLLIGLRKCRDGKASRWISAKDVASAHSALSDQVKWWLLYHVSMPEGHFTLSPTGRAGVVLPQEFPVLLALFHMGNVVRYDPERLARLYDSRAAPVLEALRRHGLLTYLITLWSLYTQKQHIMARV
jgi:hypothetical protein